MVTDAHLSTRLLRLADRHGDKVALAEGGEQVSFAAFVERALRFGSGLRRAGLREGAAVALLLPDIRQYLEADYGLMAAGLVRVPIDPRLAGEEMVAQFALGGVKAVVTSVAAATEVARLKSRFPDLAVISIDGGADGTLDFEELVAAGMPESPARGDGEQLAALNFSGGSTGAPKAVMLRHRNLSAVMDAVPGAFDIRADSVFLNVRPLWPIAQVIVMSYLFAGSTVHLGGRFEAEAFCGLVAGTGATRTSLVPTQLVRLLRRLQEEPPGDRLDRLEVVHVGGSRLNADAFARALDLIGPKIGILYGLTEAPITTYLPPADLAAPGPGRQRLMGSAGYVLPPYTVRLGDGSPMARDEALGEPGEILIRGDNVMAGYWRNPEETEAALRDGWLHTSDIGAFDEAGRLFIVGRLKDVIRTGSSTVLPKEVEEALATFPGVSDVAVAGLPDPEWGEAVTAFVKLEDGVTTSPEALIGHCKGRLASFKRPKRVVFVDEIPRSHYGKVIKPQLIRMAGSISGDVH
ncbi:MAG: class I adenylate-forming enzyme family protein [Azospirillaceae bacterium]